MDSAILATKLNLPPPQASVVARPRLLQRLDAGLGRSPGVTLVSAPAGFGKTTLIGRWITRAACPVAWLSLDKHDNNPPRFFAYLAAALRTTGVEIADAIFEPMQLPGPETLLIPLLNQLTAVQHNFALALDDYHVIHNQQIHHGMAFMLENLPPRFHLILLSRADPPLPLARLRAQGRLIELRAADLRFSSAETAAFFQQLASLPLSAEQIAVLGRRTEGWAAGLQLAAHLLTLRSARALHSQDPTTREAFINDFAGSHRYVIDYLADEVYYHQPESIRQFLTQTAILERLTAELCNAVTRRDDGRAILNHLDRSNLFLVPLDGQRCWYRYHHLFAEFLRQQAAREIPGPEQAALHRRASRWFEAHHSVNDAIDHALSAGDWDAAVRLLNYARGRLHSRRYYQTWQEWLAALPTELLQVEPGLCVEYAWALILGGSLHASERPLQAAEAAWRASGEQAQLGIVYATRAFLKRILGDLPAAISLAREALLVLRPEHSDERYLAAVTLGTSYHQTGQAREAELVLTRMAAAIRHASVTPAGLVVIALLGLAQVARGKLRQAFQTYSEALPLAEKEAGISLAVIHALMAQLHYERNELETAAELWQTWLERWEKLPHVNYFPWLILNLARLQWVQGTQQEAFATLDRAAHLARQPGNHRLAVQIQARRVRFWLDNGNLNPAAAWLRVHPASLDDDFDYLRQSEYLARVRVLIHQADPRSLAEAKSWLARLLTQAETDGRRGDVIEILALKAILHWRANRPQPALATLEKALALAEPEGYLRTLVDNGQPMAELLREARTRGIAPVYIGRLLAAFPQSPPTLVEPLSKREIEVLGLIAAGYSTNKMAQTLIISIHTVRTHVKNIYGKLGVSSRVQAAEKARDLNLL